MTGFGFASSIHQFMGFFLQLLEAFFILLYWQPNNYTPRHKSAQMQQRRKAGEIGVMPANKQRIEKYVARLGSSWINKSVISSR
jgi:hypothetical protein